MVGQGRVPKGMARRGETKVSSGAAVSGVRTQFAVTKRKINQ